MSAGSDAIVIAGAGIAGLAAAHRLQGSCEAPFVVFDKGERVGGYSRTMRYKDFRFDLGGHRFYTKKQHVQKLVEDLIGDDLLQVDRVSRILFNGRFVNYPLSAFNTLKGLGLVGAGRGVLDYGAMKVGRAFTRSKPDVTFEEWALHRFGRYLYDVYFRGYTEKTWGIDCRDLSADFAEQRIKGLSFREAVKDALFKKGEDESLVRRFIYPRYGFGQLTDRMAEVVREPNRILTGHQVSEVWHEDGRITAVTAIGPDGQAVRQPCGELLSSLAVSDLARALRPAAPPEVIEAAGRLRYRSVIVLLLVLDVEQVSPDHWIYMPAPEIGFCRLHEPKNWSRDMAPAGRTALVLEYFCQEGDARWQSTADQIAAEAVRDLASIGLIQPEWASEWTMVHMPKSYPVYQIGYQKDLDVIRGYLAQFSNLTNIGRNASFLYTSSDHYIDMGLKAAENILGHEHDLDRIGREGGYAETWQEHEK